MKNENLLIDEKYYIVIEGWMRTEINLKNNELLVFAIIHGFTKNADKHEFNGSLQYLANWCGCSKQCIHNCLTSLVNKNYIIKSEIFKNNVKFCSYTSNKELEDDDSNMRF